MKANEKMSKEYTIYTKRIAFEMRQKGFKFLRTGINPNHPQFLTYIFENSPEFQMELNKYKKK